MIGYASNTGTKRTLELLRAAGCWRILLSPARTSPPDGFRYAIDNGAWGAYRDSKAFDTKPFEAMIKRHGAAADFVVAPDIVAAGIESLAFSVGWLPRLRSFRVLLPVQDGMEVERIHPILNTWNVGIFLGGSAAWKMRTIYEWGQLAHKIGCWYHVGRVNSAVRIRRCYEAGATSFDGSGPSIYSSRDVPLLTAAISQPSLITPASNPVQWSETA